MMNFTTMLKLTVMTIFAGLASSIPCGNNNEKVLTCCDVSGNPDLIGINIPCVSLDDNSSKCDSGTQLACSHKVEEGLLGSVVDGLS